MTCQHTRELSTAATKLDAQDSLQARASSSLRALRFMLPASHARSVSIPPHFTRSSSSTTRICLTFVCVLCGTWALVWLEYPPSVVIKLDGLCILKCARLCSRPRRPQSLMMGALSCDAHDMCPKRSFTHQLATTTKASSERFSMPGLEVERRCSHASSLITWTLRIPCALVHGQIPATNRVC